jgi:hypothetical protein
VLIQGLTLTAWLDGAGPSICTRNPGGRSNENEQFKMKQKTGEPRLALTEQPSREDGAPDRESGHEKGRSVSRAALAKVSIPD